ncbi:MAG: prolipoprotein diacylglyceryl transferase family protein [Thermoanaerobaculia bacterium]
MPDPKEFPPGAPKPSAAPDQNLGSALVYGYNRANANTREVHRANSTAGALAELLLERGVLDRDALDDRIAAIGADLERDYSSQGMGVALQEAEPSKYEQAEVPEIDCESRWHLCKGSCCKLGFALTQEDVEEGIVRWDLRRPYLIARGADGRCVHQESGSCRCSIYESRPRVCRGYDCRKDTRIWLDFDRRIPNPDLEKPDWPASVADEPAPPAEKQSGTGGVALPDVDSSSSWQPVAPGSPAAARAPLAHRARRAINRLFDSVVRPRLSVLGRSRSSFQVWGYSGLGAAILLGVFLVTIQGLSFPVLGALAATACATFLALAMATKIVTGEEKLIYYHHEVAILLTTGVALRLLGQPVLPYLELTLLAVGMFLAWGRVGCLMVGCCHGRPHTWGVRYGPDHASNGFASHLTGIRLFPIQLVEAVAVLVAVLWGTWLIVQGRAPGEALALYVMGYGAARFIFEFARGDPDRPYLGGFSEAQWTSLLLMSLVVGAGLRGDLPLHFWYVGSVGLVAIGAVAVAGRRGLASIPKHEILHPHHLDEVARILRATRSLGGTPAEASSGDDGAGRVLIGTTSQGYQLSAGTTEEEDGPLDHYGLSKRGDRLTAPIARVLERLILQLEHSSEPGELVSRKPGLFHLLVRAERQQTSSPET